MPQRGLTRYQPDLAYRVCHAMIDILAILVPHAVIALAVWRLLHRDDLDTDPLLPRDTGADKPGPKAARRPRA